MKTFNGVDSLLLLSSFASAAAVARAGSRRVSGTHTPGSRRASAAVIGVQMAGCCGGLLEEPPVVLVLDLRAVVVVSEDAEAELLW